MLFIMLFIIVPPSNIETYSDIGGESFGNRESNLIDLSGQLPSGYNNESKHIVRVRLLLEKQLENRD